MLQKIWTGLAVAVIVICAAGMLVIVVSGLLRADEEPFEPAQGLGAYCDTIEYGLNDAGGGTGEYESCAFPDALYPDEVYPEPPPYEGD